MGKVTSRWRVMLKVRANGFGGKAVYLKRGFITCCYGILPPFGIAPSWAERYRTRVDGIIAATAVGSSIQACFPDHQVFRQTAPSCLSHTYSNQGPKGRPQAGRHMPGAAGCTPPGAPPGAGSINWLQLQRAATSHISPTYSTERDPKKVPSHTSAALAILSKQHPLAWLDGIVNVGCIIKIEKPHRIAAI
jgi:hypothetical protein